MEEFSRIKRLPPYVFNITGELKMAARKRGEDIIDLSMGNPDQPTPQHIVPGHDPLVLKYYPAARAGLEGWAARLDVDPKKA